MSSLLVLYAQFSAASIAAIIRSCIGSPSTHKGSCASTTEQIDNYCLRHNEGAVNISGPWSPSTTYQSSQLPSTPEISI